MEEQHKCIAPPPECIRVGLVEDDEAVRAALTAAIGATPDLALRMSVATRRAALLEFEKHELDVLLVDLHLPDGSGLDVIAMATRIRPSCPVMVITVFGDEANVLGAIDAGATGYLLKHIGPAQIAAQIRTLRAGGSPISPLVARKILARITATSRTAVAAAGADLALSARQIDVLKLIARGHTSEEAGEVLGISKHTVLTYVRRIYKTLGITSRAEATEATRRMGLLHRD